MGDDDPGALSRLVRKVNSDGGISYREMAHRASRAGFPMSHATFSDLAQGHVARMPTDGQLRAIAAGLGQPYADVRAAAFAQWYGYVPREHWTAEGGRAFLPADLDEAEVEEIMAVVRAMVDNAHRRREQS